MNPRRIRDFERGRLQGAIEVAQLLERTNGAARVDAFITQLRNEAVSRRRNGRVVVGRGVSK